MPMCSPLRYIQHTSTTQATLPLNHPSPLPDRPRVRCTSIAVIPPIILKTTPHHCTPPHVSSYYAARGSTPRTSRVAMLAPPMGALGRALSACSSCGSSRMAEARWATGGWRAQYAAQHAAPVAPATRGAPLSRSSTRAWRWAWRPPPRPPPPRASPPPPRCPCRRRPCPGGCRRSRCGARQHQLQPPPPASPPPWARGRGSSSGRGTRRCRCW
mmetsp:Transcript_6188/g.12588  ORF Transcript_6188/g.12588 Transcript_6188/m.12588 type:complete len:214 (+) Transcript_6188:158-799(+)